MSTIELPTDLILNIISRLPAKSVARCRCVSKLWASLLTSTSQYFTELFLTHSKTRPRLLFTVSRNKFEWGIYSCPQPQISYKNQKPSLSVTAEFYMILPKNWVLDISATFSDLIYCLHITEDNSLPLPGLYNPITRHLLRFPQYLTTTQLTKKRQKIPMRTLRYFGYDPIDKQCSVLSITIDYSLPYGHQQLCYQILKLGSETLSWRNIECPLHHCPQVSNTCINGVLYYLAWFSDDHPPRKILCFDLNSEEFKFIDQPFPCGMFELLVNFKGKLGIIRTNCVGFGEERYNFELSLWVLENVEKQEWSKHVYLLPSNLWSRELSDISVIGVTARGEVVLSLDYITHPFYVYFSDLEKNNLQKVAIMGLEGLEIYNELRGCVDYVEDLKV